MKAFLCVIIACSLLLACTQPASHLHQSGPGDDLTALVKAWNSLLTTRQPAGLDTFYAETVWYYGDSLRKPVIRKRQEQFFAIHPDFHQRINGPVTLFKLDEQHYKTSFGKTSAMSGNERTVPAYLVWQRMNSGWRIITEGDDQTDKALHHKQETTDGIQVSGDYNGDGKTETATIVLLKEGVPGEQPWTMDITFSDPSIPSFRCTSDGPDASIVSEGPLDDVPGDELTLVTPPLNGNWYNIRPLTLHQGKWAALFPLFLTPSSMLFLDDSGGIGKDYKSPGDLIFRDGRQVYYYEYVNDDEHQVFRWARKRANL